MIPTLDWGDSIRDPDAFALALGRACGETGCFLLVGHGISPLLRQQAFREIDRLFDLPRAEKAKLSMKGAPQIRGWLPQGRDPRDTTKARVYRNEAFELGPDLEDPDADDAAVASCGELWRRNIWPDLPGFRATMLRYLGAAVALSADLHGQLARDLGQSEERPGAVIVAHLPMMRLQRFLPGTQPARQTGGAVQAANGSLTLIQMDDQPRLQVWSGAGWTTVPHAPGAFMVTIGACLVNASGGRYISPPHRILSPTRRGRWISVEFHLH